MHEGTDSSQPARPAMPASVSPAALPHESPPWSNITKAIIASSFLILGALVIWRFQFLIMPLTMSVILSYLLHPLIRFLNYRLNIHRTYVVIGVYLVLLLLFVGGMVALGLVAADQLTRLAVSLPNTIPQLVQQAQTLTNQWAAVEIVIGPYEFSFEALSELINWNAIADEARAVLQQILGQGTMAIAGAAQATLSTLASALTVFFISIYISIEGPRIGQVIGDVAHQPGYRQDAERLIVDTLRIWNSYLRGQVILALLIFAVVSLALSALQVNNALALGILSGLLEFLPIIGPIVGSVAAVLVAFFQTPPWGLSPLTYALIVLAVMVVIQQVEGNILVPRMVGDSVNVHPILVMIGVLMGASLAGLVGAVLAAPVVGTLKVWGVYVWRKMLDLHPFPEDFQEFEAEQTYFQKSTGGKMSDESKDGALQAAFAQETSGKDTVSGDALARAVLNVPLTFAPIFKDYVWGGRNLADILGRELPEGTVAESWEIADHANGASRIDRGPLAGQTLSEVLAQFGIELAGTRNRAAVERGRFPLLIKLLDAQRPLSVQVHPGDEYAQAHEGELGKTEMWIVLHAAPGAEVVFGFAKQIVQADLRAALEGGDSATIEELLHRVAVQAGDVIFVPAGAIHALGAGIIVAEIQQNSDTTYRLYDWGRPREIHVEKALDVTDMELVRPGLFEPRPTKAPDLHVDSGVTIETIGESPYFTVERIELPPGSRISGATRGATFEIFGVLQGKAALHYGANGQPDRQADELALDGVAWTLLPAVMGEYTLVALPENEAGATNQNGAQNVVALRVYTPPSATPPNDARANDDAAAHGAAKPSE